jgi:hypothetical protein
MKSGRLTRNVALVSGAGLAVVPMAFAATPSLAAADCGEGTEVTAGICEKAFTTAGDYTFAVPASVSKMSAVLVGGGQGGVATLLAYGGGGGGVVFVDSVDISQPISFTVGVGGEYAGGEDVLALGGDTTVGANTAGGGGSDIEDPSPDDFALLFQSGLPQELPGYADFSTFGVGSGGGAGGEAKDCAGGPGLTASSVAAGSSLFPAVLGEPVYGAGGSCSGLFDRSTSTTGAGKGGDVYLDEDELSADAGTAGAVIFRWSYGLPDTGMNVQPWLIGASVAAVLGGAVLASGALRVRRQGRHSN